MYPFPNDSSDSDEAAPFKQPGQQSGLLEHARLLERELRGVLHDHLFLAALETRRAGESLVRIIVMGLIAAGLLLSAWLALAGAVVVVLVQRALLTPGSALALVFVLHCLLAMILFSAIRKSSSRLLFPASISRLEPAVSSDQTAGQSSPSGSQSTTGPSR